MKIALWTCTAVLAALAAGSQSPPSGAAPSEPTPLVGEALTLVRSGDTAGAVAKLEAARQAGTIEDPERALLGALYVEAGRFAETLEVVAPLLERDDVDPMVLYNAGRAALELGRVEEAEAYLEAAVRHEVATPAIRLLGFLRMRQGNLQDAYGFLVAWSSMDPSDLEARTVAVYCALKLERFEEAGALVADLPADEPRVGYLRGRLRAVQGETEAAAAELRPFVDFILTPPDEEREKLEHDSGLVYDILTEYGRAMLALGRGAETVAALEKATAVRPEQKEAWQLLGQALLAAEKVDEAQAALARYQELAEQEVAVAREPQEPPPPDDAHDIR